MNELEQGRNKSCGNGAKKSDRRKRLSLKGKLIIIIVSAIIAFAVLNVVWNWFEVWKIPFPSPLSYSETLQSVIDVVLAVVIAVETVYIEWLWKQHDAKEKRYKDISERIINVDSLNNVQIIGYAIPDARLARKYKLIQDCKNCDLCIAILFGDRRASLIPLGIPVCSKQITACEFKSKRNSVSGESNSNTPFPTEYIRSTSNDKGAFLFFDHCEQNEPIVNFLSDVLNCNCESNSYSELIIILQCTIDQPDFSNSDAAGLKARKSWGRSNIKAQRNMTFDCEVVLSIRPTSAFLNPTGDFNCGVVNREIYLKEQSDEEWRRFV